MPSAPSVIARSNAAMVFSGAAADAPRWAITTGRPGDQLVVSIGNTGEESIRENTAPGRAPPRHLARRTCLLRHSLRRGAQHSVLGPRDHRAKPRDVCRPGPRLHPGPPARVLHGLERL